MDITERSMRENSFFIKNKKGCMALFFAIKGIVFVIKDALGYRSKVNVRIIIFVVYRTYVEKWLCMWFDNLNLWS